VLNLPESNISDEEIHALAALLRNNTNIEELNLRGNIITDDGARALGMYIYLYVYNQLKYTYLRIENFIFCFYICTQRYGHICIYIHT
jgi:hypothetical protein